MSRPRRAVATQPSVQEVSDSNVDPEFLALSAKKRNRIDKVFERGIAIYEGRSNKRRKIERTSRGKDKESKQNDNRTYSENQGGLSGDDEGDLEEGGFLNNDSGAEGGFMLDDEEGGGFLQEDDGVGGGFLTDDAEVGGGFLPSDEDESSRQPSRAVSIVSSSSKRLPLRLLPSLLTSLGLPSDEDVLAVFRASASGWEDEEQPASRKKRGQEEEDIGGVELKDFRAVCAALMGDDGPNDDEEEEDDDLEDTFELPSEEESESSSLSGSEYGQEPSASMTRKGKNRTSDVKSKDFAETDSSTPAPSRRRGKKNLDIDSSGKVRLNSRQKELAKDTWEMLKPPSSGSQSSKRGDWVGILGRDEVKKWVRELGEMWNEDEIKEMVTLFSTQHEQRGLSFEDFGGIMLRAGLV
ncbi:uncharacterized protein I206_101990 [Kwoniella pini CBS 10737]|uniref:EF-hand domain-containing protein n=1 Tax=Kwoniella pini CBS 10737 TaxID=1296096 RepID=A0A1B9HV41_9TREE|nr:uncharacterized protein I206_06918 [Kwoniella pini CBS 10737]OCF47140.1 hypothetical protein I206_06918 [Kwoniella pini CBS 10737]